MLEPGAAREGDNYPFHRSKPILSKKAIVMENQLNSADAMYNLGNRLCAQHKDDEAEQCWRKAAAAGHIHAMVDLGAWLQTKAEDREAEQWWRKAAAAGDAMAMYNLGGMLCNQGR